MSLLAIALLAAASQPAIAPLTSAAPAESYPTGKGTAGVYFALPGGGAPTVGALYFISNDTAAKVDFGLDATFSPSGTPAGFSLGVGLRFYQAKHDRVGVFLQPSIVFGRDKTAASEFMTFAGAVGVEYFFTDHLSAGGTLGLGLNLTNIGGVAGSSVGTGLTTATSGLFGTIFF